MGLRRFALSSQWPPGPKGSLLGGNLSDLLRERIGFLNRCAREYGDFVSLRFGLRRFLLINDPQAIEFVLAIGSRNFRKHFGVQINPLLFGQGLLTSEGNLWLRQRRSAHPTLRHESLVNFDNVITQHAAQVIGRWQDHARIDLFAEMTRLTLGIAGKVFFDADLSDKANEVMSALEVTERDFVARFRGTIPMPYFVPTPANRRFRKAVSHLDTIVDNLLGSFFRGRSQNGTLFPLFAERYQSTTDRRSVSAQRRDEAKTFLVAGHETTALALTFILVLLAQHPEAQARLVEELRRVLCDRVATAADLPEMHYMQAVIREALRLHPPAYVIARQALRTCTLGGYRIPAGTAIIMSQWVTHRDPRYFDRPEEFRPERWENGFAERLPRCAYFPFGAGPRRCIGESFALIEIPLVLATILQRFFVRLVPHQDIDFRPSFTLRPAGRFLATVERHPVPTDRFESSAPEPEGDSTMCASPQHAHPC
jgi:cytochrome P450